AKRDKNEGEGDIWLFQQYSKIAKEADKRSLQSDHPDALRRELDAIEARIRARQRTDTEVTLLGRLDYPFDCSSSMLNSFLIWQLFQIGGIRYLRGDLKGWEPVNKKWVTKIELVGES